MNRRDFLVRELPVGVGVFAAATASQVGTSSIKAADQAPLHVATNTYPWVQFAKREGRAFPLHTDESLAAIAASGIPGYEPVIGNVTEYDGLAERLRKYRLEMRSIYVSTTFHDERAEASLTNAIAIAQRAAAIGVKIIVSNPAPIQWGGDALKSDDQLKRQADYLNRLGEALQKCGLVLAYHNHDIELRAGAREFHHMLTGTDPQLVKFCLDLHWVYRGCGNSQVAVFDVIKLYGQRIVELHLRQSRNGVWTEVFEATGDIDYPRVMRELRQIGVNPHLVLEQAVEERSPKTLSAIDAHKQGLKNLVQLVQG